MFDHGDKLLNRGERKRASRAWTDERWIKCSIEWSREARYNTELEHVVQVAKCMLVEWVGLFVQWPIFPLSSMPRNSASLEVSTTWIGRPKFASNNFQISICCPEKSKLFRNRWDLNSKELLEVRVLADCISYFDSCLLYRYIPQRSGRMWILSFRLPAWQSTGWDESG